MWGGNFDFYEEQRKGYWRRKGEQQADYEKTPEGAAVAAAGTWMALLIFFGLMAWCFASKWLGVWPNAPIPPLNDPADLPAVTREHVPGF